MYKRQTPKSLLRNPKCVSDIANFSDGKFQCIIDDVDASGVINKIVLCTGKIFYDLLEKRERDSIKNIAIIRVEQLFPLDKEAIKRIINKYNAKQIFWVQEEPENMGAWNFILSELRGFEIEVISRPPSAATASGSSKKSVTQQQEVINKVFKK